MIIIIYKDKEKTTIYSVFDRHVGVKMGALEKAIILRCNSYLLVFRE